MPDGSRLLVVSRQPQTKGEAFKHSALSSWGWKSVDVCEVREEGS